MSDRRHTSEITGRRQSGERRKDAETRTAWDEINNLTLDHLRLFEQKRNGYLDAYNYHIAVRRLIEDAAKKIRVIQEKEESHAGI